MGDISTDDTIEYKQWVSTDCTPFYYHSVLHSKIWYFVQNSMSYAAAVTLKYVGQHS